MHICLFLRPFCCLQRWSGYIQRRSGCFWRRLRSFCRVFCKGIFYMSGVLLCQSLLCSADRSLVAACACFPVSGGAEESGSDAADYGEEGQETLFMTIYDENGAKRLLSSKHPARLAKGIYFAFPDDVRDCEICTNGGGWIKTGRQTYVMPPRTEGDVLLVQFRARTGDGSLHHSRSFALMRKTIS